MSDTRDPMSATAARRVIGVLFGVFFMVLAVLVLATVEASSRLAAVAVALVLGGLGLDLVVCTLRGGRSLLSRIGPLP